MRPGLTCLWEKKERWGNHFNLSVSTVLRLHNLAQGDQQAVDFFERVVVD